MLLCRAYLDPSRSTYQDTFLTEADEDVSKMAAALDAADVLVRLAEDVSHARRGHISILMQARPATGAHPRAHRLAHTAPTDSLQIATPY